MTEDDQWYGPDAATFGDRLAAARDSAGMKQSDLAKRLGVKLRTLQAWEQDLSEPRANKLSMMSGLLNVSMGWLITGEGEGLGSPEEDISPDLHSVVMEMRTIRTQLTAGADKLARLEKKLREIMKAQA